MHSNGVCHTGLPTACEQDQDGRTDATRKLSANMCDIYHCCVQRRTPDDGQRNYPKYVEFYFKNKFEKLVHLVCFNIRICHDAARSPERQKQSDLTGRGCWDMFWIKPAEVKVKQTWQ